MKVSAGILCACLVVLSAGSASAQNVPPQWTGFYISGDLVWIKTYGNDVHVGDVVIDETASSGTVTNATTTQSLTFTPIVPKLDTKATVIVEGGYRGMTWGYGGRVWGVSTDGAESETVRSAASSSGVSRETYLNMFSDSLTPYADNRETSALGPITYEVNNHLKHVRIDGYAERIWLSGAMGVVTMRFGLGYANIENTRDDSVALTGQFVSGPNTFNQDTTLGVTGSSEANLLGPTFGIAGNMLLGNVELDWLVSPGALFATHDSNLTVTFQDIDRTRATTTGLTTNLSTFNAGLTSTAEGRTLVPTVDLQLKAAFPVLPTLSVGGGIFSSTLFDMPVAPAFDNAHEQLVEQSRTVTFLGYSVFAKFRF
jgi:hypothetical protein